MNTYNCPRCGSPSTIERCPVCGRGPEPLLARLGELDAVLATMPATLQSRAAVEAERVSVLKGLTEVAARYLAEAEGQARSAPTPQVPAYAAPAAPTTPPGGAPQVPVMPPLPPYPEIPPHTPPGGAFAMPRERGEVGSKTVQTVLLSLGGLLVAAALIIFTAVAWRNMGNGGRAGVLGGVTLLLLAIPFALKRFRLWATAETFAALAALALWCTTLAGYYLYRPPSAEFGPEAVGAWTAGVLVVLAAYRALARLTATSWVMLPLAVIGSAYAAAGSIGTAVVLMLVIAGTLGAAAWITGKRPGQYATSDKWAGRFLTCAAVVAACSAGLRAAFGVEDPVVPSIAAAVAVLAAANLIGVHFAQRLGVTLNTMLIAGSAAGSLVLCAWVLAVRSGSPELVIPSLALLCAGFLPLLVTRPRKSAWAFASAVIAGLCGLAAFAIVAFDAPDLAAYFTAFLAARLLAPVLADPLGSAFRTASYAVGTGTAMIASLVALGGLGYLFWGNDIGWTLYSAEVPIVLVAFAVASVLLPKRFRVDGAALAVTFAVASGAILWWDQNPARFDAVPTVALLVCAAIGLAAALFSRTLAGRCTGWVALAVWAPLAGAAADVSTSLDLDDAWIRLWLTVTAAAMLVIAVGAPRRSRPDRVLAAVLAHVLGGTTAAAGLLIDFFDWTYDDDATDLVPALQFGVYALALAGAAIMAPVRKWGYVIAALCTGSLGWWSLLAALDVSTLEFYTAPPAAVLFLIGLWRLERHPDTGSWSTLALPILIGLAPSLLLAIDDGNEFRRVGVGAAAIAVIVAGLARRWQAPLVLGSIALAVLVVNELLLLRGHIPTWVPPAIGGAILLVIGATFERRRRDLRRLREGLKAMR
ncbi:SCO7613 C-terminal domain-containing membrane protein [Glycomyces sp. NPDC048151]|uniref:SCO7613 C-terminal domain-containing membrane protein n=1 Tax=Glycomyces sp. NPDC048151 TaxID=3364002 RepID=UPI00372351F0